ncbi:hypothetical protein P3T43_002296 [Paraburkholderia sp. GAS41]
MWTTDKDGIVAALLSAEMTTRIGRDPAEIYRDLTRRMGEPVERRMQVVATAQQRALLSRLSPAQFPHTELAGEPIEQVFDRAPGNHAAIGGIKVITRNGWFAARPSGTEDIYNIYAESFLGEDHLTRIVEEAQARWMVRLTNMRSPIRAFSRTHRSPVTKLRLISRRASQMPGNIGSQKLSPRSRSVPAGAASTDTPSRLSIPTDAASNVPSPTGIPPKTSASVVGTLCRVGQARS